MRRLSATQTDNNYGFIMLWDYLFIVLSNQLREEDGCEVLEVVVQHVGSVAGKNGHRRSRIRTSETAASGRRESLQRLPQVYLAGCARWAEPAASKPLEGLGTATELVISQLCYQIRVSAV